MSPNPKTVITPKAIIWRVVLTLFILLALAGPGAQVFHAILLK